MPLPAGCCLCLISCPALDIILGVGTIVVVAFIVFRFITGGKEQPHTLSKEWQAASAARASNRLVSRFLRLREHAI